MYMIDLLKGQGVPIRSRPEGIAIAVVTAAAPVIVAIIMFSVYLSSKIATSVQMREINNYETKIKSEKLLDAIELQREFEKEKVETASCLSEVFTSVGKYTQWSQVLVDLVKNMPDSVVLTKLTVSQQSARKRVPQKNNPTKMIDVSVPVKTLQMKVCGNSQTGSDEEIKGFKDRLRLSASLGPKLDDIKISQGFDKLNGIDVVAYEIDCVFKPEL